MSFRSLSAGDDHTCGIRVDGTVTCWGYTDTLGHWTPQGAHSRQSAPAAFTHAGCGPTVAFACWGHNMGSESSPPGGNFKSVSAGGYSSCGVRTDDALVCLGHRRLQPLERPRSPRGANPRPELLRPGSSTTGTDLSGANLQGAKRDLQGSDDTNADLSDANLQIANLSSAFVVWRKHVGCSLEQHTVPGRHVQHPRQPYLRQQPDPLSVATRGIRARLAGVPAGLRRPAAGPPSLVPYSIVPRADQRMEHGRLTATTMELEQIALWSSVKVDFAEGTPLYQQVAAEIRRAIAEGEDAAR